jgi:uncharacterized protein YdiU (UPF0061 family)
MSPIRFENSYAALPERFYARVHPAPAPKPVPIRLNAPLAARFDLDVDWLASAEGLAMLSGTRLPESAQPIAMAYAGHQFGSLVPQLGDGRAHLIGELLDRDGRRFDVHLKGSGRTPFSRRGDGRAALGPVLREYIVSEAFAALGIPGTRALAAVLTGESVYRETTLPGAVLTRLAESHVRVGTFQYFAVRDDRDGVRQLADYVIARHYPELAGAARPYLGLLEAVAMRQASLIARWMGVGFIHGVMNTDNMQIAGETIDFGPCAFMDRFHAGKVFSSIDRAGRYAWNRQPQMAQWNLARLAECLLPLIDADQDAAIAAARDVLARFDAAYLGHEQTRFSAKLGLAAGEDHADFVRQTLSTMAANGVDFTLFFRRLTALAAGGAEAPLLDLFAHRDAGVGWLRQWRVRHAPGADGLRRMQAENPIYIPRNHRVAAVIAAAEVGDFGPFHALVDLLAQPFAEQPGCAHFELPPAPEEEVHETFCGT